MPCRIIGTTNEVVEGNVVEVSKGDQNGCGRLVSSIFVKLVHCGRNTGSLCGLRLSDFVLGANEPKGFI